MSEIACVGNASDHGGVITVPGQVLATVGGTPIAVSGAMHVCPLTGHGTTPITATAVKTWADGKLVVRVGDVAGCGARILTAGRIVTAE